jgi:hypothetical protein
MQRIGFISAAVFMLASPPVLAQGSLGLAPASGPGPPQAPGTRLTFVCPAGDGRASVYGTDVYTAESGVCAAAVHAGVLRLGQSGVVTLVFGGEAESFRGSARNGVTTQSYGRWPYTYTFASDGAPGRVSWTTVWSQIPTDFFEPVSVECPAGGKPGGPIWGTGTYTKDSTICVAGVHAGVISAEKGGVVTVKRVPGLRDYPGTERFGVVSTSYGPYADAFTVEAGTALAEGRPRAQPAPAPSPTPPPATEPEPEPVASPAPTPSVTLRTVAVRGFEGHGSAAPSGPRTVTVAGFTGTGGAPAGPRTIAIAGWSGHGAAP